MNLESKFSYKSFLHESIFATKENKIKVMGDIADKWKELSGENNWEGLLDPLDNGLCNYIIHYGESVQAVYDAVNEDTTSSMYGFSLYPPQTLFSNVCLETKTNPYKYTVTDYLYAFSDIDFALDWAVKDRSAWIGYVAVATDEGKAALGRRDILISWRGTLLAVEWFKDFDISQIIASDILAGDLNHHPKVHKGFHSLYTTADVHSISKYNKSSVRHQVLKAVRTLVEKYKHEEVSITITGHSLGSALAILNAVDIVANKYNKPKEPADTEFMVTAFVFACPKVGNSGFKTVFDGLKNLHVLLIRNEHDIIPRFPYPFYSKVGKELRIDTTKSTYLNISASHQEKLFIISHNLEIYLHGVAITQKILRRDISLVNKSLDVLKNQFGVPPKWWLPVKNKGMVQHDDGTWKLEYYEPDPPSD